MCMIDENRGNNSSTRQHIKSLDRIWNRAKPQQGPIL